jgi:hypothetical protein
VAGSKAPAGNVRIKMLGRQEFIPGAGRPPHSLISVGRTTKLLTAWTFPDDTRTGSVSICRALRLECGLAHREGGVKINAMKDIVTRYQRSPQATGGMSIVSSG